MSLFPSQKSNSSGMAIMEILIMLSVLAVVLAITIPKFKLMLYQSRESRTKMGLSDLRGALAIYYSDHAGVYPSDEGTPETRLSSVLVPQYLKKMPATDLVHFYGKRLSVVDREINNNGGWVYTTAQGLVAVNSTHLDTQGKVISGW